MIKFVHALYFAINIYFAIKKMFYKKHGFDDHKSYQTQFEPFIRKKIAHENQNVL